MYFFSKLEPLSGNLYLFLYLNSSSCIWLQLQTLLAGAPGVSYLGPGEMLGSKSLRLYLFSM